MKAVLLPLLALLGLASSLRTPGAPVVLLRRSFLSRATVISSAAGVCAVATSRPSLASAAFDPNAPLVNRPKYTPKFDDIKVILALGITLDNLAGSLEDVDKWGTAGVSLAQFAKDPNFYPTYARNYVLKIISVNGDADSRVIAVSKAVDKIISISDLISGDDASKKKEAIGRVREAQVLIGKFLEGSGVEDERVATYVKAHKA